MIVNFNKLRIDHFESKLLIEVNVPSSYTITSIRIYTKDSFMQDPIFTQEYTGKVSNASLDLNEDNLNMSLDDLFFVSVDYTSSGTSGSEVGAVTDFYPIYWQSLEYIRDINKITCDIPKRYIDFILLYKAFILAITYSDHMRAIDYYNRLLKFRP